ncbi:MAG: hypothetical protein Q4D92_09020, partial [Slackia sp.]|nr:hypothetical protein [Slackia sp.]
MPWDGRARQTEMPYSGRRGGLADGGMRLPGKRMRRIHGIRAIGDREGHLRRIEAPFADPHMR